MKSAFLVGARKFEVKEIPEPVCPPDGLLLKVVTCGICGSDLRRFKEGPPANTDGIVPGHEVAGIVLETGKKVKQFKKGDRIAIAPDVHCGKCYHCKSGRVNRCDNLRLVGITPGYPGGFSEIMVITGEILKNGIVHKMPAKANFVEGAIAESLSSVLSSHFDAGTKRGDTVLIFGAGPIGCLHAALAKALGAKAIVVEPNPARRELALQFKPSHIIDPSSEDVASKIKEITSNLGVDIVICANPVSQTQTLAVDVVRKGGQIVLFGGLPKSDPFARLDSNKIHYGEITVRGAFSYTPAIHKKAIEMFASKKLNVKPFVTHTFPIDKIQEAFETLESGKGLKIVIEPNK